MIKLGDNMNNVELTDEEILKAVKISRDISNREGKKFEMVLETTLRVMTEEKEKKLNAQKQSEVVEEPIIQENSVTMNNDSISELIARNKEIISEMSLETEKLVQQDRNVVHAMDYIKKAEKGQLKASFFDPSHYSLNKSAGPIDPNLNKEFFNRIKEINNLVRENSYIYYKTCGLDLIENERLNTIESYKQLRAMSEQTKQAVEAKKAWGLEAMTTKAENDISRFDNLNQHYVGLEGNNVQSYDTTYSIASIALRINNDRIASHHYNKRYFEEMQQVVDKKIQELEQMSSEQYRQYKISQMKLTPEEIAYFEQHINEFMATNENSRSR